VATPLVNLLLCEDYRQQVQRAATTLRDGGLVVVPTETVYGVAAVASNPAAMTRLRALRGADNGKPLTVHLDRPISARAYIGEPSALASRMIGKLWPGPVSLTFDVEAQKRQEVARRLEVRENDIFDGGTLTLRCPSHPVASDLLSETKLPVVLTVAGGDGATARQVDQFLSGVEGKVDLVLDAGPTQFAKPSTIIHVTSDSYRIERAGIYDERIIERLMRTTVLFVCSGNTCRSPMAEALARKIIADRLGVPQDAIEHKGYSVVSAGAFAMPGSRATPAAVEAVAGMNADLSRHRSRPLTPELVNSADLIFAMGQSHKAAVLAVSSAAEGKVHTLDPQKDIEDPIGGDLSLYRELAAHMETLIARRLDELLPAGEPKQ
jgi:L-threonylcarbamoyladenylate synthase